MMGTTKDGLVTPGCWWLEFLNPRPAYPLWFVSKAQLSLYPDGSIGGDTYIRITQLLWPSRPYLRSCSGWWFAHQKDGVNKMSLRLFWPDGYSYYQGRDLDPLGEMLFPRTAIFEECFNTHVVPWNGLKPIGRKQRSACTTLTIDRPRLVEGRPSGWYCDGGNQDMYLFAPIKRSPTTDDRRLQRARWIFDRAWMLLDYYGLVKAANPRFQTFEAFRSVEDRNSGGEWLEIQGQLIKGPNFSHSYEYKFEIGEYNWPLDWLDWKYYFHTWRGNGIQVWRRIANKHFYLAPPSDELILKAFLWDKDTLELERYSEGAGETMLVALLERYADVMRRLPKGRR